MQQENGGESCVSSAAVFKVLKCTSVLVETEKNAHSQSNAFFLRCNYISVWSNWERAMLVQEPQSVRRSFANFCLYSIVALECFCGLLVQISHVCQ